MLVQANGSVFDSTGPIDRLTPRECCRSCRRPLPPRTACAPCCLLAEIYPGTDDAGTAANTNETVESTLVDSREQAALRVLLKGWVGTALPYGTTTNRDTVDGTTSTRHVGSINQKTRTLKMKRLRVCVQGEHVTWDTAHAIQHTAHSKLQYGV